MTDSVERPQPARQAGFAGVTITEGAHPAGSALPWHHHDGPTLCFVLEGGFVEGFHGASLTCEPAMLKVTPGGESHFNRFAWGDTRGLMIEIDPERYRALRAGAPVLDERVHFRGGVTAALAFRLAEELRTSDRSAPLVMEGLLLELLGAASRRQSPRRSAPPPWVVQAREILHEALADGISLAELAQRVGAHPVTLSRAFRRAYGCSVGEYLRRLRIERATQQLGSDLPLARIALEAGFADQSHFSNQFRRHTGFSPSSYRRAVRGRAIR